MGLGDWLDEPHHGKFSGFSLYTQTAFLRQKVPPTLHGPYGYVVAREETDARLVERAKEAGADFRSGVRATKLLRSAAGNATGVEAVSNGETLSYEAPLVIAADGVGGFAGEGIKAHQNSVARRQYFRNVSGPERDHLHVFVTKDMNEHGAGYGWVFYFGNGRPTSEPGSQRKHLLARVETSRTSSTAFSRNPRWSTGSRTLSPKDRRRAGL